MPLTTPDPAGADSRFARLDDETLIGGRQAPVNQAGRNNLRQLVQLRWLAVAGQLVTVVSVHFVLHIRLPVAEMLTLLSVLLLFNIACWARTRWVPGVSDAELFSGLLVDVAVLSGQLYYSGWSMLSLIFTIAVVVIMLAGSIWVMFHLNANMMPVHDMRNMP